MKTRKTRKTRKTTWIYIVLGVVAVAVAAIGGINWLDSEKSVYSQPKTRIGNRFGAFLGSDKKGVQRVPQFESWLGLEMTVGRTYLPGEPWTAIEGDPDVLGPWLAWVREKPGRRLALNVPMIVPNEGNLPDEAVRELLSAGAAGEFDSHFAKLSAKLVASGVPDAIIVLGWEMNGSTYSSRCGPDIESWKRYWRRIVATMRAQPGQRFTFDFAPNRGPDAVPWTRCYPGDDVVDIIGMDNYDQPPGKSFADYVDQPYGLRFHAEFAAAHGKPISFPEWGLFRYGDQPAFVRRMLYWIRNHNVAYHAITDYCPHGVWACTSNPQASRLFRALIGKTVGVPGPMPGTPSPSPAPTASPAGSPPPSPA